MFYKFDDIQYINNSDDILNYIKTAINVNSLLKGKKSNIVELGANLGLPSVFLRTMGHSVLCTDIHYGALSSSLNVYKAGTWLRENFIGHEATSSFTFGLDNLQDLNIFKDGIDLIFMRGTGIVNTECQNFKLRDLFSGKTYGEVLIPFNGEKQNFISRTEYLAYMNSEHYINVVSQNIIKLLEVLNHGGILYLDSERIVVTDQEETTRMNIIQKIIDQIYPLCRKIDFKFELLPFPNSGWIPSNATFVLYKN